MAVVTFFAEHLGLGPSPEQRLAAWPLADAAHVAFLAALASAEVCDFEAFTAFQQNVTFANGVKVIFSGGALRTQVTGTIFGRYPTSGNKFWNTDNLTLIFQDGVTGAPTPIAALGFYGVDIGDYAGRLTLTTNGVIPRVITVPHTVSGEGVHSGGVLYFGFYVTDPDEVFTRVVFGNSASAFDAFGYDDFTIGTFGQLTPPLPAACPAPNPAATGGGTACPATLLGGGS